MLNELLNWIAMIELPVFAALFRMIIKQRREFEDCLLELRGHTDNRVDIGKEALADFKLHVARNYVSTNYLKDVENRLTNHLLRIEKKLDEVGRSR
ncbi:MAG: hypothetical protein OSJ76_03775 [Alphaproteobacteria bacterium]|nr:hypothetical protein [Alphaproteobacteria bacterium]